MKIELIVKQVLVHSVERRPLKTGERVRLQDFGAHVRIVQGLGRSKTPSWLFMLGQRGRVTARSLLK